MTWWNDPRHNTEQWYESFDKDTMKAEYVSYKGEEEETLEVECKYVTCDTCNGKGSYVNPNIDDRGLSYDDFDRNPGFRENYSSGMYDITCVSCEGLGKEPQPKKGCPNYARVTKELREAAQQAYYDRQTMAGEMGWH